LYRNIVVIDFQVIDIIVVICANIINILIAGIFLSRPAGQIKLERILGIINLSLGIPLLLAVVANIVLNREWWAIVLPVFMISFLIVELILDYIFNFDFRSTRLIWPYLLLFYFSQWMLIGYSFQTGNLLGFITLVTYFLCLGCALYSYSKVGHGKR